MTCLLIASRTPQEIVRELEKVHNFKLKGSGPTSFHLGCDFFCDDDGVLCYAPKKYIVRMLDTYERIFGKQSKQVITPLNKGDHPEMDTSDLLEVDDINIYQSLIGTLQWVIQIGRFDITTSVMTLSRFRAAPRKGHLDRVKQIYSYLSKMRHGIICICTELPDYSTIPKKTYNWDSTCYEGAEEVIPKDLPRPLGKAVQTMTFVDANLFHRMISGRSVTGILHLLNKTPIDWFSKLQSTGDCHSKYVAAHTAAEQIIDLRNTLRYLGVPIRGTSMMLRDNETVVKTASVPYSKLHK
jgi:hypothetical protein